MTWTEVANTSEIAPGTAHLVEPNGLRLLLCNTGDGIYTITDVCTHDGGPLDQGELEGHCVICPRHGATFDVRTGQALTLPAVMPVITYPVRVDGDDVYVEL